MRSAVLVSVVLAACLASGPAAADPAEVRGLLARLKKATSAAEREDVATRLFELGDLATRRLEVQLRADAARLTKAYLEAFSRAAGDVAKSRGDAQARGEIPELQRTIREVAAAPDLTKEMIEARSDPALKRLEEIVLVSRDEVLEKQPALAADRDEVLAIAALLARAGSAAAEGPAAAPPAEAEPRLRAAEDLAVVLGLPVTPADRRTLTANAALSNSLDPEEEAGMLRLNVIRMLVGLPAQAIDPGLVKASRRHSQDMSEKSFFAHESPVPGRETPWDRARAEGTDATAENIAAGMQQGTAAIGGWWHSPGHHRNMLGDQPRTGLGRFRDLWTQLFG